MHILNCSPDYDDPAEGHEYAEPESYEAENWDETEDLEDFDAEHAAPYDAASKQSSDTLSTLSKRSREEDDEDDESTIGASAGSPGMCQTQGCAYIRFKKIPVDPKRVRTR